MATDKKKTPQQKAAKTDKWMEILFKALAARVARRWRFTSFRGAGGGEWKGIVDVLAIRKDSSSSTHDILKSGDLFDMILIQMKGGSAKRPTPDDLRRLEAVKRRYDAREIVLFSWKGKGKGCTWETRSGTNWRESSARDIFGG